MEREAINILFTIGSDGKVSACNVGPGFNPWVGKIPWRRKWQPTPVLLPGKFYGWRNLVGYIPWGHKESDMAEWLHFHFSFIVTPVSNPGAKYGNRYLLDGWVEEMTGVEWYQLLHSDGILCHLVWMLNITEYFWFKLTINSYTYLTGPLSGFLVFVTSQTFSLNFISLDGLTNCLLINSNRQKRRQLHILKHHNNSNAQLV